MTLTTRFGALALVSVLSAAPALAGAAEEDGAHAGHHAYKPLDIGKLGGPFSLTDEHGGTVTEADFKGKFALIYFGYGRCTEACPTVMQTMADALDELGPLAEQVVPVFVDFDLVNPTPEPATASAHPERRRIGLPSSMAHGAHLHPAAASDAPAASPPMNGAELAVWARNFHPRFVALTGTRRQIFEAARAFHVRRDHVPARWGKEKAYGFRIDHTTHVYLLGPDGKMAAVFYYGETPEAMAAKLREKIAVEPAESGDTD